MAIRVFFLAAILFGSCSTPFKPKTGSLYHSRFGYSSQEKNGILITRFEGNEYTSNSEAQIFAHLRATDLCLEKSLYAKILVIEDQTLRKRFSFSTYHTKTNPVTITGSTISNSGVGHTTITHHNLQVQQTNRVETVHHGERQYPIIDAHVLCLPEYPSLGIEMKFVEPERLPLKFQDSFPAFAVKQVNAESPNYQSLRGGDIILKVDNERIVDEISSLKQIYSRQKPAILTVIRDGSLHKVVIHKVDKKQNYPQLLRSFFGQICQKEQIARYSITCKTIK